jgi:Protein of unknown function (DUF2568)
MAIAALTVRFVVEMAAMAALGFWAWQSAPDGWLRIATVIGVSLAFIVVWGRVAAPRATNGLSQPQRDMVGTILILIAAVALALAGQSTLAAVLAIITVVDWVALIVLGPDAVETVRPTAARLR